MKKLSVVLLVLCCLVVSCVGVYGAERYPNDTVKIGVPIYDPTDVEFLALRDYFEYLKQSFNVEFIYSEALSSAEDELQFIENCAIAGCQGIIGYYNISKEEAVATAVDYDMFYWGLAEEGYIYDTFKDEPYYLGSVNYGDGEVTAGYHLGKYVIDRGSTNIVYSSGGADFGIEMFVKRRSGFLTAVEEAMAAGVELNIIEISGFPSDAFFAQQANVLSQDIDAVCASFNALDTWAQPIVSAGKKDKVLLTTIGSINEDFVKAFQDGTLSLLAAGNIERFGIAVAMIINAVDGNADALKADGVATNLGLNYWLIDSYEEASKIYELQQTERIYSAETLKRLIKNLNPEASPEVLEEVVYSAEFGL